MVAHDFTELTLLRRVLQEFCEGHFDSLGAFRFDDGQSFKRNPTESPDDTKEKPRHLTSSATCIESLLECPATPALESDISAMAQSFAQAALEKTEWKSDDSGDVYCRCRTLPLVISRLPKTIEERQVAVINGHLDRIFGQVCGQNSSRFGIGEWNSETPSDSYPPNAYHSYWALKALRSARSAGIPTQISLEVEQRIVLWAKMKLGTEVALHCAKSPMLDSDQLAWAITVSLAFSETVRSDLAEQDLLRHALSCLFLTQTDSGIWPHYRPLFHYRSSGNAYCYNFETLATMLSVALRKYQSGAFFLDLFAPHVKDLRKLFEYARRTRQPLDSGRGNGWLSGHRSTTTESESWATASVYAFAQAFRRMVGMWTKRAALTALHTVPTPGLDVSKENIRRRGKSWSDGPDVAEQLQTLFVNPFCDAPPADETEPDTSTIRKDQSRSAILFGPPGTSKTTLARAIAGQLGWKFVELHSSHFVAEGLGDVQKVADQIFERLMQLDRTVVLFDEIDELVRFREQGTDQFGRFLTTSMLPRLAELWDRRKIIYFVNTNYIYYFDSAITRSERFDALIFVAPPSFESKSAELVRLINEISHRTAVMNVSREQVDKSVESIRDRLATKPGVKTESDHSKLQAAEQLAKFKLVRWDQLRELAEQLLGNASGDGELRVSASSLRAALSNLHDAELKNASRYTQFLNDETYARRDFERLPVYEVELNNIDPKSAGAFEANGSLWLRESLESITRKYQVERTEVPGKLVLQLRPVRKSAPRKSIRRE
jgi:ATPase family associated with various cellular activities (AAA)